MTPEAIAALFAKRSAAFARRDVAALVEDYVEDCVVETPTLGTIHGRSDVESAEHRLFADFPDLRMEDEDLVMTGNRVVLTATVSATDHGGRLTAPDARLRLPVVIVYTLLGDRIARERRIWDFSGMLLQRVQKDLKTAAEVQQLLLPAGRFVGKGFEIAAASVPCRDLGGDFFDYFTLPDGTFAFSLGDVAGKGPPASLLSASIQAVLAVHGQSGGAAATLAKANRAMLRRPVPARFATAVYGVLSSDGRLTYSNAGHNPPLLFGGSGARWLGRGGMVLGILDAAQFEEETLQLHAGDVLVAFSDGITEAQSAAGTDFGEARLLACVEANHHLAPEALVSAVLEAVEQFTAGARQADDLTVLALAYHGT
jgi:ketosteroid isomerase-like protein